MPRKGKQKQSQGGKSRNAGTQLVRSLGAGIPGEVVRVPRSLQTEKTLYFRGTDVLGIKGTGPPPAMGFGIDSMSVINASPTQQLVNWLISCGNWDEAASLYEQFRPTTLRLRAIPSSNLVTVGVPYVLALDVTGDYPVGPTIQQVSAYRTSKILETNEPFELAYALPAPAAGIWYDTAVATELVGALLVMSLILQTGQSGMQPYACVMFEFEVKMRGIGP